jgi:hypothetical protein
MRSFCAIPLPFKQAVIMPYVLFAYNPHLILLAGKDALQAAQTCTSHALRHLQPVQPQRPRKLERLAALLAGLHTIKISLN